MQAITIRLDEDAIAVLRHIAQENGAGDLESFLRQQVEGLVTSYRGKGLTPDLGRHLSTSIDDNRRLLERLAE